MSAGEWAGFFAGVCAVLTSVMIGLRFLVKGWLNELRPNGGVSMKDQLTRLEKRVDELYVLMSER
jgi:hypothetical protein